MRKFFSAILITLVCFSTAFCDTKTLGVEDITTSMNLEHLLDQMQHEVFFKVSSATTSTITAKTGYLTFRMPYAFELIGVRARVLTAPSADMIIDINNSAGTTIFNSYTTVSGATVAAKKLYIQSGSTTSVDAYTSAKSGSTYHMTTTTFSDNERVTVDIDSTTGGKDLELTFYGRIRSIPTNY